MARSAWYEIAPHETVDIPEFGVSVRHDGRNEATAWVQADGTLKLDHTSGEWLIRKLPEPTR